MNPARMAVRTLAFSGSITLGLLLFQAAPAGAVGCSHGGGVMTVQTSTDETATVSRSGSSLTVNGVTCGPATVTNTDTVLWDDLDAGGGETFVIDLSNGPFAPGMTDELGTSDEIEFDLSSDPQVLTGDFVFVFGTSGPDTITAGDGAVPGFGFSLNSLNLNNDLDNDVSLFDSTLTLVGERGDDVLHADGGAGTGGPFDPIVNLVGGRDADSLADGDNDDNVFGERGNDRWIVGLGIDSADGGPGANDTIDAGQLPNAVVANLADGTLAASAPDTFSGFEALEGTPFDDELTGGGAAATSGVVIKGKQGDDLIEGTNFQDLLLGGRGNDDMQALAGDDLGRGNDGDDEVRGGAGEDLLAGGGGEDFLRGGGADDLLRGQGQDDNIGGNAGNDILNGGTATDRCIDRSGDNSFRSCEIIFGPGG